MNVKLKRPTVSFQLCILTVDFKHFPSISHELKPTMNEEKAVIKKNVYIGRVFSETA